MTPESAGRELHQREEPPNERALLARVAKPFAFNR